MSVFLVLQSKRTYDGNKNAATEHIRNQNAVLICQDISSMFIHVLLCIRQDACSIVPGVSELLIFVIFESYGIGIHE